MSFSQHQKKILALDLGTVAGWAVFCASCNRCLLSGFENFTPKKYDGQGMRFLLFEHWLKSLLSKDCIAGIFFEDVKKHKGVYASHCYGGFLAVLSKIALENSIDIKGVGVGVIKKAITGKGNAKKKDVINAVNDMHLTSRNIIDHNEADAVALGFCAVNLYKK